VSDFSDEEQWEEVKRWLRQNLPWIAAGVVIGIGGLVGWRAWEARQVRIAQDASTRFEQVVDAFNRTDRTRAFTLVDELTRDYAATPYADLATLVAARSHVEANELDKAAERLTAVMNGSKDAEIRLIARLRLARVLSAQGKHDEAIAVLNAAQPGKFKPRFDEARGDILYAKGNRAEALAAYQEAYKTSDAGVVDPDLLALKIRDLGGKLADSATTAAQTTAAATP